MKNNLELPDFLRRKVPSKNQPIPKYDYKRHFVPNSLDLEMGNKCQCDDCLSARKKKVSIQILKREQTKERVFEMLSEVITKDSKMTKGALIKYIRENFKEQTVYSDVGKVASKVINQNTGHSFSKWQVCTTQRHIRKVK
tara:strand:- start:1754 stop:2173 length:420 start_codon:yes stop_codon:yes gene_type:complete